MGQEIERKFLVIGQTYREASKNDYDILQGYISSAPDRSVRVRVKGAKGYLTIKGKASDSGISRFEWEKEIALEEALALFEICEPGRIRKRRYEVSSGDHTFEVDEFFDENQGLVMAEVELSYEEEPFVKPAWIGLEVTGDPRYYNSMLMKKPYTSW